ncbi:MAG TPA: carboxypeptidase regulatory-like domain-containing protein [Verrucomicrobiae bacterium]|nr:carboxypeptidase regulatory-like domain-containing protein [Verrucomicrobiae bacterium]
MRTTSFFVVICLLLLAPAVLPAQITTATIVGTVTDKTGAAVVGAEVTATNTATNLARSSKANEQGEYRIEFLPVGNYSVAVNAAGFKKSIQNGVILEIAQTARVDASLDIGPTGEVVEVTSDVPIVNTSTTELGRTVENEEITDLPIVNRNLYTLLDLTPGVQRNDNSIVLGYPEQRTLINGGVDGGAGSVNYFLDGGISITGLRNTGNILPNPDAVQEFRVQTNSYSAEYGRFASGVINVLTKSGTNDFHGSGFEFLRNTILNANTWGNTFATPPFHRNQFGGTLGGPIVKDKTFFFASYGGLRQNTNTFLNGAIVPSALERTGDFSQSAVKPVNPVTHAPFPSNKISAPDPVAMNIINQFIPQANLPGNKWQGFVASPFTGDEFLGKVDHSFSENRRLTASYFETSGSNTVSAGGNLPWSQQQFTWRQHEANVSDTWSLGPDKINQVWLTYTRNFAGRLNVPQMTLATLGSAQTVQGTPSLPQITVTGFFTLGQAIAGPLAGTNFYAARDTFSYNHGRHAFKFGGEVSLDKDIQQTLLNNYGVFTFNGTVSKNALADFEIGLPSSLSQDAPVIAYTNTWYTALFAQDDFRVHPRLTFNLGLRWDVQTAPTDPQNKESTYVAGVQSTVRPTAPLGILFPGDQGFTRGIVSVPFTHFSPRFGFAWDPFGNGKTAVRAGAGIFYGSVSGNQWNTTSNFEPFAIRLTFNNNNSATKSTGATLSNPYRNLSGGDPFPYNGQFVSGGSIFGPSPNFHWPYTYQLNFAVQHQVTSSLAITAAYVGSLSHNLPFAVDLNYPTFAGATSTNIQARRPNPAFGQVLSMQSGQTASYNGLQISATQRTSHHLSFNAFYIYSKTFDSVQLQNSTTQGLVQNFAVVSEDRGLADTDMRHQLVLSMIWQPDYYDGRSSLLRQIVNGWSVSPILKLHSGFPFTVLNGKDANLDGNNTDRAQQVGDPRTGTCPSGAPVGSVACWFNTSAFTQNQPTNGAPVDGSSPRNSLTQPAYKDVDLAISRTFKVHERLNLQVRAEALNVFNIVSLNAPNSTVGTATFGTITSALTMRQLQLGARIAF